MFSVDYLGLRLPGMDRGGMGSLHTLEIILLLAALSTTPIPGVAMVVAGRELCDVDCPRIWDPVCSTKQVTYFNTCFLYKSIMCIGLRDVREAYRGACTTCVSKSTCSSSSAPVCGNDGHTYLNFCIFQVSNKCRGNTTVNYKHRGPCAPNPQSPTCRSFRICHVLFMPVCGSDGRTYGNTCELDLVNDCRIEADKVQVVRDGECTPGPENKDPCNDSLHGKDLGCMEAGRPVCGSDGVTYQNWRRLQEVNDQRMDAYKVDLAYMGHCLADPRSVNCRPVTKCPTTEENVCGTDHTTYINHCHLFRTNECREYRRWVHLLHEGPCHVHTGLGKAGPILMKITIVLVVVVVIFAVLVPLYYARRSYQLVTSWNTNATTYAVPNRGRYHLVATVGNDMHQVSIIPVTDE